jgi:hypothetical protein
MRRFLGWLVLVAALGAAAYVLVPMVARPLVADAVRTVSPFGGEPVQVDVEVSALGLLRGSIDRIHLTGAELTTGRFTIGRLDVSATDVGILDHAFTSMTGTLETVKLRRGDGSQFQARQVQLEGPSTELEATAAVGRSAALDLVRRALEAGGLPTGDVALVDGGVRVTVLGQPTTVALGAADGALTIAGSIAGGGSIVVFGPEPGDPWRITGVSVSPSGLEVHGLVEVGSLLR